MRIVSLVPSVTETLSAWRRDPVACTRFCERPDLPSIGGTKDPDVAAIIAMRPDLVILDEEENRRENYDHLMAAGLDVGELHIQSLADVNESMVSLAERVEARWSALERSSPAPIRLRALVPIWRRPWMALGQPTYGASVLEHLGVTCLFGGEGRYPYFSPSDARDQHPDVVLAPSEPYPFTSRQLPELEIVAPTTLVDGKDLFWWGSRTAGALERLAAQLATL